jgi:putative membrane protein
MVTWFSERKFREGLVEAVHAVGALLAQHFPRRPDDTNELPNEVRVR